MTLPLDSGLTLYPLFLPSLGLPEMAVLFVIVLILFGPGKLPQVFRAMGEGVRQFKDATKTGSEDASESSGKPTA